ncbi:hypothetical protein AB0P36_23575 [Streptomyces flavidovirens]
MSADTGEHLRGDESVTSTMGGPANGRYRWSADRAAGIADSG